MKHKLVKTRKKHLCNKCGKEIPVGELALFVSDRIPTYDYDYDPETCIEKNNYQTGIIYNKTYTHNNCVAMVEWNILDGV